MNSPFQGLSVDQWQQKTLDLIEQHPLDTSVLREAVLSAWDDIFESRIGSSGARIGHEIFLVPQAIATLLQELIALHLQNKFPKEWRRDRAKNEKDLVYLPNDLFSIEVKTSSSANDIYGNRSYAQPASIGGKSKSGYYPAVNFDAFTFDTKSEDYFSIETHPVKIRKIRFGWLDHSDWKPQASARGQQSSLSPDSKKSKLIDILSEQSPTSLF